MIINKVFEFCERIKNNRTLDDIYKHSLGEMDELQTEIEAVKNKSTSGPDGIKGEAIDVILCMLDILYQEGATEEEIEAYMIKKSIKWERVYGKNKIKG
jgi:hypothetical protein